jgi:uncharacterized protein YdeI (YjbR/CyaY-like superfamily)
VALRHSAGDRRRSRARLRRRGDREAGREVRPRRAIEVEAELPAALAAALERDAGAREAFHALTPWRQREYAAYVAAARRAATVQTRIERILPIIRAGSGLNDRYRS